MNRILFSVFLFCLIPFLAPAQSAIVKETYKTENNISYRSGENIDAYQKERCKLDIYYPENVADTIGCENIAWIRPFFYWVVARQKQNPLHLHHDFRERFTGTLIDVHSMIQGFKQGGKGVLKKQKKVLEKRNNELPLPNFHQKKWV